MVKDSQLHAAEDQTRKELIDTRNQADALAYQVEKTVNDNRDKIAVGDLSRAEAAIAEVRKVNEGDDLARIKSAAEELRRLSHAIAEALYKSAPSAPGGQSGGGAGATGTQSGGVRDAEVVDAEYAETR